jgi:hypothetical protein
VLAGCTVFKAAWPAATDGVNIESRTINPMKIDHRAPRRPAVRMGFTPNLYLTSQTSVDVSSVLFSQSENS